MIFRNDKHGVLFEKEIRYGSSATKTTDASGNIDIDGLPIYAADGSKITYTNKLIEEDLGCTI